MERLRFSFFWRVTVAILFSVSLLRPQSGTAVAFTVFEMRMICWDCGVLPSTCQNTGTCKATCDSEVICLANETCASIWRSEGGNVSVEMLCHNPAKPLYGAMLNDYNSTECVMKQYEKLGPDVYMCSCSAELCNEQLVFPKPWQCGDVCTYLAVFAIIFAAVSVGVGSAVCLQKFIRSRGGWRVFIRHYF